MEQTPQGSGGFCLVPSSNPAWRPISKVLMPNVGITRCDALAHAVLEVRLGALAGVSDLKCPGL